MNREIKFRGQKQTNGVWVYGSLVYSNELDAAIYFQRGNGSVKVMDWVYVKPGTVGQFTGLYDKDGKEIYEGDIVERYDRPYGITSIGVIEYQDNICRFVFIYRSWHCSIDSTYTDNNGHSIIMGEYTYRVIGNIHDNPELLKGGDE